MIDSTVLCAVVDECAAGAAELVVEGDGCCEAEQALEDALSEAGECSSAVALEGEDVLAGPEDALDALSDRREVGSLAGLVFASWSEDCGVHVPGFFGELCSGVSLVADHGHFALPAATGEQLDRDLALALLGRGQASALGVPSGAKIACKRKPQK